MEPQLTPEEFTEQLSLLPPINRLIDPEAKTPYVSAALAIEVNPQLVEMKDNFVSGSFTNISIAGRVIEQLNKLTTYISLPERSVGNFIAWVNRAEELFVEGGPGVISLYDFVPFTLPQNAPAWASIPQPQENSLLVNAYILAHRYISRELYVRSTGRQSYQIELNPGQEQIIPVIENQQQVVQMVDNEEDVEEIIQEAQQPAQPQEQAANRNPNRLPAPRIPLTLSSVVDIPELIGVEEEQEFVREGYTEGLARVLAGWDAYKRAKGDNRTKLAFEAYWSPLGMRVRDRTVALIDKMPVNDEKKSKMKAGLLRAILPFYYDYKTTSWNFNVPVADIESYKRAYTVERNITAPQPEEGEIYNALTALNALQEGATFRMYKNVPVVAVPKSFTDPVSKKTVESFDIFKIGGKKFRNLIPAYREMNITQRKAYNFIKAWSNEMITKAQYDKEGEKTPESKIRRENLKAYFKQNGNKGIMKVIKKMVKREVGGVDLEDEAAFLALYEGKYKEAVSKIAADNLKGIMEGKYAP